MKVEGNIKKRGLKRSIQDQSSLRGNLKTKDNPRITPNKYYHTLLVHKCQITMAQENHHASSKREGDRLNGKANATADINIANISSEPDNLICSGSKLGEDKENVPHEDNEIVKSM